MLLPINSVSSCTLISPAPRSTPKGERNLPKRFDIVLLDADETVYDFKLAEKTAVSLTLEQFGVTPTDEVVSR